MATLLAPFGGPHPSLGCAVLPPTDEFNRDISADPLDPRSDEIISRILADGGDDLHPDFGSNPRYGIPYVVVPGAQPGRADRLHRLRRRERPRSPTRFRRGPRSRAGANGDGDRHVLVVRRPAPRAAAGALRALRSFERGGRATAGRPSPARSSISAPRWPAAPRRMDLGRRRGPADLSRLVTFEEAASGGDRPRDPDHLERTRRGYIPARDPLGLGLLRSIAARDGHAAEAGGRFRQRRAGAAMPRVIARSAATLRRDRRRQRIELLHQRFDRRSLERQQPEPAQGHPGDGLRGRRPVRRRGQRLLRALRGPRRGSAARRCRA